MSCFQCEVMESRRRTIQQEIDKLTSQIAQYTKRQDNLRLRLDEHEWQLWMYYRQSMKN